MILQFPSIDRLDRFRNWKILWKRITGRLVSGQHVPQDILDFEYKRSFIQDYIKNNVRPHLTGTTELDNTKLSLGYYSGIQFGTIENLQAGIVQKLLGVYEVELTDELKQLEEREYQWIVNIGAAEGLYSIRFSQTWRDIPVYSFEQDFRTRQLLRELKKLNNATDVIVLGEFKSDYMKLFKSGSRGLVFSDCEGFEKEIFNMETSSNLIDVDLVIETHDHLVCGVHHDILQVLSKTHDVHEINQISLKTRCERVKENWFTKLPLYKQMSLLNEDRHPSNRWIIALSRSEISET